MPDEPGDNSRRAPTRALSRQVPLDLVGMAGEIQSADQTIGAMTGGKLQLIAEQIRRLQEHARSILEQARIDASLHRASCLFRKRPGHVYHLYRRDDEALYFSMLSPEDWRGSPPDAFEGSFRLELDMSWTPYDRLQERDSHDEAIRKLLEAPSDPNDS
ncbi:MAG: DUF2452 domain-containing protein [Deltaproteobacteria bacterium]|nr:DUF2452 domain-containing protein [Deltaproteobacteria bacterium]